MQQDSASSENVRPNGIPAPLHADSSRSRGAGGGRQAVDVLSDNLENLPMQYSIYIIINS
jgi:hypothetical protein